MTPVKRQKLFRLPQVHRCIHKQAPAYLTDCVLTNKELGHRSTQGLKKLYWKSVRTELGQRGTTFEGAQEWNSLPEGLRAMCSHITFIEHLKFLFLS